MSEKKLDVICLGAAVVDIPLRPVSRDTFYNNIEDSDFIKKLNVGLCFKERVKQIMPGFVISWLKRRF